VQRDEWRAALEKATAMKLLSARAETGNPTKADQTIETAISQVRWLGQDAQHPLVAAENTQYGFERNVFGMRQIGRAVSTACVLVLAAILIGNLLGHGSRISPGAIAAGLCIDFIFAIGWFVLPSESRTKAAAERYAQQLLQAVVVRSKGAEQQPPEN
jgi:hypothetical protein